MRPKPLSGFPELLPADRIVEQAVLDTLRRTFELHGFASIETRAVETMESLTRKGEITKEVYVVRRLQAGLNWAKHRGVMNSTRMRRFLIRPSQNPWVAACPTLKSRKRRD